EPAQGLQRGIRHRMTKCGSCHRLRREPNSRSVVEEVAATAGEQPIVPGVESVSSAFGLVATTRIAQSRSRGLASCFRHRDCSLDTMLARSTVRIVLSQWRPLQDFRAHGCKPPDPPLRMAARKSGGYAFGTPPPR